MEIISKEEYARWRTTRTYRLDCPFVDSLYFEQVNNVFKEYKKELKNDAAFLFAFQNRLSDRSIQKFHTYLVVVRK